jgi:hypothetical protein
LSLELKSKKIRALSGLLQASLVLLFALEIHFILNGSSQKFSLSFAGFGVFMVLSLHFIHWRLRSGLVEGIICNLSKKRNLKVDPQSLKRILTKDLAIYMRKSLVLIPKFKSNMDEFQRVEGLSSFVNKYKTYAELNLLDEIKDEINKKNKAFYINLKELFFDTTFFVCPPALIFATKLSPMVVASLVVFVRFAQLSLYFFRWISISSESCPFSKIESFSIGSLETPVKTERTRIDLAKLVGSNSASTLFLIDRSRRDEIEEVVNHQVSVSKSFSDWSVISSENSIYKKNVKSRKAFILFPNEMLFPHDEMREFISAFDQTIVVDSSPDFASVECPIFYLDQDQKIKRVNVKQNLERLSGDKGLILRTYKKNNLELFLTQVEKRIIEKRPTYLIYGDVKEGASCAENFVYPAGQKMLSIVSDNHGRDAELVCDLNFGEHNKKIEKAKTFLANCSYHKVYTDLVTNKDLQEPSKVS